MDEAAHRAWLTECWQSRYPAGAGPDQTYIDKVLDHIKDFISANFQDGTTPTQTKKKVNKKPSFY